MKAAHTVRPIRQETPPPPRVTIQGANPLMNHLLSHFLQEQVGVQCILADDGAVKAASKMADPHLVLVDFMDGAADQLPGLLLPLTSARPAPIVGLFNVSADACIEKTALKLGAHGVFYLNEAPGTMAKGVKALLAGELWFSRRVTSRLLRQNCSEHHCDPAWNDLTPREKEILQLLASGASNQQLADHLCISLHTVKTHLYNIFKKIDAENRLQAMLWAVHHSLS